MSHLVPFYNAWLWFCFYLVQIVSVTQTCHFVPFFKIINFLGVFECKESTQTDSFFIFCEFSECYFGPVRNAPPIRRLERYNLRLRLGCSLMQKQQITKVCMHLILYSGNCFCARRPVETLIPPCQQAAAAQPLCYPTFRVKLAKDPVWGLRWTFSPGRRNSPGPVSGGPLGNFGGVGANFQPLAKQG